MLGNAWHFPSALWLLFLILLTQNTTAIPTPPPLTNIQKLSNIWLASNTPWGPPQKTQQHQRMPQLDWHSHLRWAKSIQPPTAVHTRLDPSICWAIDQTTRLPNIQQIRKDVLQEIRTLVSEFPPTSHRRVVSNLTKTLPASLQTKPYDHPDPSTYQTIRHNPIPAHLTTTH